MRITQKLVTGVVTAAIAVGAVVAATPTVGADPAPTSPVGYTQVSQKKLPPVPDTGGQGPAQSGFWSAFAYGNIHPNAAPSGANDFNCKPKEGQNPVVLLHGTYENAYANWAAFSPVLKKKGYCVFAPNYGRTDLLDQGGMMIVLPGIHGVAKIRQSSQQLAGYVDRVRKATGSDKVDIIAHSQGGLIARHYLKFYGGASQKSPDKTKVERLIMFGTPNHGTTLLGLAALGRAFTNAGLDTLGFYAWLYGAGPIDQAIGSPAIETINNSKKIFTGIEYTSVSTRYDEIVTMYDSAFIHRKGVKNITLQDGCEQDTSDHLSMMYSSRAMSIALRALDPVANPKLVCAPNAWLFSF